MVLAVILQLERRVAELDGLATVADGLDVAAVNVAYDTSKVDPLLAQYDATKGQVRARACRLR